MGKLFHLDFSHDADADRQTASLAGLVVSLLVVVICVFLLRTLHAKSAIEDCLMAGRNNCDLILARLP